MSANLCKSCKWWRLPDKDEWRTGSLCDPVDPDSYKPMERGFKVRLCRQPTQTFCETPVERNGFGLADASEYFAVLATAEDFGCVRHEPKENR